MGGAETIDLKVGSAQATHASQAGESFASVAAGLTAAAVKASLQLVAEVDGNQLSYLHADGVHAGMSAVMSAAEAFARFPPSRCGSSGDPDGGGRVPVRMRRPAPARRRSRRAPGGRRGW
jgi:hypothetical protein